MHILTKRGNLDNVITYEHICDTTEDMAFIERKYITLGSTCVVLQGEGGGMEVYMADSNKEWHDIMISGNDATTTGLELHVCTSAEVQNGKPKIDTPLESTLYLVPSGAESGNLYDEYVYVNEQWELFGGARVNMSGYATESWVQQQGYLTRVPHASDLEYGTVKLGAGLAQLVDAQGNDEGIGVLLAPNSIIKQGTQTSWAVPVSGTDAAAFYGLAKAAGDTTQAQSSNAVGTYTAAAKTAIQGMLDVPSNSALAAVDTLPAPGANGTGLVSVNGEWVQQPGYGFIEKGEEISLYSTYGSLEQMPGSSVYVYNVTLSMMQSAQKKFIEDINKYIVEDKITYLNLYIDNKVYTYTLAKDENDGDTHIIFYSDEQSNVDENYIPNGAVMFAITNSEQPSYTMSIAFPSPIENTDIELFINEENIKQIDTKYIPILGDSCNDGVALISVDNKWVKQAGYGYAKEEDTFVFSELSSPEFELENQEYNIRIPLSSEQLDLWDQMFYDQMKFKIKINDTVYEEGFGIDNDTSTITVNDNADNNWKQICRLTFFSAGESSQGIPEILFTTDIKPDYIKIYDSTVEYFTIDSNLLPKPNINVDNSIGEYSIVMNEKANNVANGSYSTAQGAYTVADGHASHAEGDSTSAIGHVSHAEGSSTLASGEVSHAEGSTTFAYGRVSHAEGIGDCIYYEITAHPSTNTYQFGNLDEEVQEGWVVYDENSKKAYIIQNITGDNVTLIDSDEFNVGDTLAFYSSTAFGEASHTEGYNPIALSDYSHAEGKSTKVLYGSEAAHAEGYGTVADAPYVHVDGTFNVYTGRHNYVHITGIGTSDENRANGFTVDNQGKGWFAGTVSAGTSAEPASVSDPNDLTTKQYVDDALAAKVVSVEGTTPEVAADADTQYICGEVSTLSFTPAATGISDIIFESGSTATVLTVPNTVKFPDWFDATALEPNMVYEISIMNGTYGAVMAWATT